MNRNQPWCVKTLFTALAVTAKTQADRSLAGDLLLHYLDASGTTFQLPPDAVTSLRNDWAMGELEGLWLWELVDRARQLAQQGGEFRLLKQKDFLSGAVTVFQTHNGYPEDWIVDLGTWSPAPAQADQWSGRLALNRFTVEPVRLNVDVAVRPDGSATATVTLAVHVFDLYDYHPERPGKWHWALAWLAAVGWAKPFEVAGEWERRVTCWAPAGQPFSCQ